MRKNLLHFFAIAIALVCSTTLSAVELKDRVVGDFSGNMVITIIAGDNEPVVAPPAPAIVKIAEDGDAFLLALNNFLFEEDGLALFVGNIAVSGITITDGASISINAEKDIEITEGDADFEYDGNPVDLWMGPIITEQCGGFIPITLAGNIEGEMAKMTIDIDATEGLGMIISVKFEGTNPTISNEIVSRNARIDVYTSEDASTLYVKGLESETPYILYNMLGTKVGAGIASDAISISSLSKGVYFIKLNNKTAKFIKK